MAISWSTIQTLLFLVGPLVLPKIIGLVRAARIGKSPKKDLDYRTKLGLNILASAAVLALFSSLPYFQVENIIKLTGARLLLTPNDVLTRRLESLRQRDLSTDDLRLLHVLRTREGRLIYAAYGPQALIQCSWCTFSDPASYLYYSIPTIAIPHIINIATLGLITSSLSSKSAKQLRIHATIAGLGLALGEFALLFNFDVLRNIQAVTPGDTNWLHWRLLTYRGLGIATIHLVFGVIIYLNATGRYGFGGTSDLERMEEISKSLDVGLANVRTGLFIKSASTRSVTTLSNVLDFWRNEASNRQFIVDETEVTRSQLMERMDIGSINEEAFKFTSNLMDMIATARN
ncbi:hypothetical protein TWF696_009911 [Orbilia brochopaga]|uniref:Uncharacterized protein n=1 Tax=Orbilia brochopaga TaxID=3140254 RepID=A0AAV9UCP3_9PEZI